MTTTTLYFLGGMTLGGIAGFVLAACFKVGDPSRDDQNLDPTGYWHGVQRPEKTLRENVHQLDKGGDD
jgi:hypothetical protein